MIAIDNDNANFVTGYVVTDVDGSLSTDLSDMIIADNNNAAFVQKFTPGGVVTAKRRTNPVEAEKNKSDK